MICQSWDYVDKIAYSQEEANKITLAETADSRIVLWCLLPGQHIDFPIPSAITSGLFWRVRASSLPLGNPILCSPDRW